MINIARPWLRYVGWWREPKDEIPFQRQLDQYVTWMRDEPGFSASTVEQWQRQIETFLRWCSDTNRQLADLQASDLDRYLCAGSQRWSRISVSNIAKALRVFLRHAATQGACDPRLARRSAVRESIVLRHFRSLQHGPMCRESWPTP
jgi:integrase/recombinase XerD